MAKSPDYTGKLTIYSDKFEPVGEMVMYRDPAPEKNHPEFYGQIHLTKEVKNANFGLWKHQEPNLADTKCPRCNAPKKPQYKLCYKCNLLSPTEQEAKP